MTAPVTVTTADYAAVKAFFRDERTGLAVKFQLGAEPRVILEAFARHRQQAAAASNAQIAELREAVEMLLAPLERASAAMVAHGKAADANAEATFDYVHAILARAKSASEAEGV